MPWTPKSFADRHNSKLTGEASKKASAQANAMLENGVPEGEAIATANKTGDKEMSRAARMKSKMYTKGK